VGIEEVIQSYDDETFALITTNLL